MSEQRSVDCKGEVIEYTLVRKKVKNINMRVKSDGSVSVSAPNRVPVKFLDDFVRSRYDFIRTSVERLSKGRNNAVFELDENHAYENGDKLSLLGDTLTVDIRSGTDDKVFASDGKLVIQTFDTENSAYIQKLIHNFLYNSAVSLFRELNDEVPQLFSGKYSIEKVPIRLRKMKSRWGSCHVTDGFIVMNTRLVFYPKKCAKYVLIHEYAHFIEPNHSAKFYAVVSSTMPDYKIYSDLLK